MKRTCECGCGATLRQHINGRWPRFIRGHHLVGVVEDLRGRSYGKLVVFGPPDRSDGRTRYECRCECGRDTVVEQSALKSGKVKSCGCLKEIGYHITHAMTGTPTYRSWAAMHGRCRNPKSRYGKSGITVCERWLKFENFLADMGERPVGCSLGRERNSEGYSPSNCRWETPLQQAQNRRQTTYVVIRGRRWMFSEAVRRYGEVSYHVAKNRVNRDGWDPVSAIITPAGETPCR